MFFRIGQVSQLLGVSITTLRLWDQDNSFSVTHRTVGWHRRYSSRAVFNWTHRQPDSESISSESSKSTLAQTPVVIYARVSASKQRNDLIRQELALEAYARQRGWQILKKYRDIASGLNDRRAGLLRLLKELPLLQSRYVLYAYPDRLSCLGRNLLQTCMELFDVMPYSIMAEVRTETPEQRLVNDKVAILTSFAGKLHRQRRSRMHPT